MPKRRVLAAAVAFALSASVHESNAQSIAPTTLPTGGRLVAGQASISQSGANMQVQQGSARAALDWNTFSIGSQASVTFSQPSASSVALNRVLGNNASEIYGRLSANGQVFLMNPNGVLFARGAQVDVGGLLASTLSMSSDDFMAGRYILRNSGATGSVVNQGSIKSAPGGYVAFVGPTLQNDGTIESPVGTVSLTAANAATLEYMADGLVRIRVDERAVQSEITNNGVISADGGGVFLTATGVDKLARAVVNNTGIIEARSVETTNGVVRLGGGQVELAGNAVLVDGRVDVSATEGKGGSVKMFGDQVGLINRAQVDASGALGGGQVLVGGNYQGKGPAQNASYSFVGKDVSIDASARTQGDGGRVVVWSNEGTQFYGQIAARGGAQSGSGGFVETSGGTLQVSGTVDTSAANGTRGTWLLDPKDILIASFGIPYSDGSNNLFSISPSLTSTITPASINVSVSDVVLQANNDVTFAEAVSIANSGTKLTAQAGRSILVNANISTNNGNIFLTANDDSGLVSIANRDPGSAQILMAPGTAINAGTADLKLRVGTGTLGADQTSGNVVIGSLTGGRVGIFYDSLTPGVSITRADATSLVSASQFIIDSETATIGTAAAPIRISTPILEAHYHFPSGGIYIDSPNPGNLQIGGVDTSFFPGSVRGVQAGDGSAGGSGPINLSVNGNLTQLPGGAGCGLTGGTGGPICSVSGDITITTTGSISLSMPVKSFWPAFTPNNVFLLSGGGISNSGSGVITADQLLVNSASGGVSLNAATNQVNTLAATTASGDFNFSNGQTLTIGSVTGPTGTVNGISTNTSNGAGGGAVFINVTGGDLVLNQPITTGNTSNPGGTADSSINLNANNITGGGSLTTGNTSGDSAFSYISVFASGTVTLGALTTGSATGDSTGDSSVFISTSGNVTTGNIFTGPASGTSTTASSYVEIESGAISTGSIQTGSATSGGGADSDVFFSSSGDITVSGSITTGNANAGSYADSYIDLTADPGNIVVTGALTTGQAHSTTLDANSYVSLDAFTTPGSINVGGPIITGAADAPSGGANSYVQIQVDDSATTGGISTGLATGDTASSYVDISAGTGVNISGGLTTSDAISSGTTSVSSIGVSTSSGPIAVGGNVASGAATAGSFANSSVSLGGPGDITTGGISAGISDASSMTPAINVTSSAGIVTVNGDVTATGRNGTSATSASVDVSGGDATITVIANSGITVTGAVTATAGAGGNATATDGDATARGGAASVTLNGVNGPVAVSGAITASAGAGGVAQSSIGNAFADSGNASVAISTTSGTTTVHAVTASAAFKGTATAGGSTSATSGGANVQIGSGGEAVSLNGNVNADAFAGNVTITVSGLSVIANGVSITAAADSGFVCCAAEIGTVDILAGSGGVTWNNGSITATGGVGATSGTIFIGSAGGINLANTTLFSQTGITLNATGVGNDITLSGGTITANSTTGLGTVLIDAGNNVTIGTDISTFGFGTLSQSSNPSGIRITAGNAIVSQGGLLSPVRNGPGGDVYVDLTAQNGIGTLVQPVRIGDPNDVPPTGPVLLAKNLGSSGDFAIAIHLGSSAGGPVALNDLSGTFNNNPNGTYLIRVENGGLGLNSGFAFTPNGSPLLPNQSVVLDAPNGGITVGAGASIQTFGTGSITLSANNTLTGPGVFLAGPVVSGGVVTVPKSVLLAAGTGNILITGQSADGAGVFVGGDITASSGSISITGTGGVHNINDNSTVGGVINPLVSLDLASDQAIPLIQAGNTVTIMGTGGTTIGTGSAQGVGFGGNASAVPANFGRVSIDANNGVTITGQGGSSVGGGAAGVGISSGSAFAGSHVGGNTGDVVITGHAGSAGGQAGFNAIGVGIGGGNDVSTTDISTFGQITINGFGGTATNVSATGVSLNHGLVQSFGGITISGEAGTASGVGIYPSPPNPSPSATGVSLIDSTAQTASSGNISITGKGSTSSDQSNATGVGIADGSFVKTVGIDPGTGFVPGTGSILIVGYGGGSLLGSGATGTGGANGISVTTFNTPTGGQILSNTGSITLNGTGGVAVTGESRGAVIRGGSLVESSSGGAISVTGIGGTSAATGTTTVGGVGIGGSGTTVQTSGDITLDGTGGTNLAAGRAGGVGVSDSALVQALGSGNISITGQGGLATTGGTANGININPFTTSLGASVLANSGTITLNGTAGTASLASSAVRIDDSNVSTSGAMNVTAVGTLDVLANNAPSSLQSSGAQNINAGGITVQGGTAPGASADINSNGAQTVSVTNGLTIIAGSGSNANAQLFAANGQTINAGYIEIIGSNGNLASIFNQSTGSQLITTTGMNGSGDGLLVENLSGSFSNSGIGNNSSGAQTIAVNNADHVRVIGRGNQAMINSQTGNQTITLQGAGANSLELGSSDGLDTAPSIIFGVNQQITAGLPGQSGAITIRGQQADGIFNNIAAQSGTQNVTTSGTLTLLGGTATNGSSASIQTFTGQPQTVSAATILLQGGATGSQNRASIVSQGGQTITAGAGGITLLGGDGTNQNDVNISVQSAGDQTITLNGGSLTLTGGNVGAQNAARIQLQNAGGTQTINMNGGSIVLNGGTGTNQNSASIDSQGIAQQINFPSGGSIQITGGTNGTDNLATIEAETGTLTITGSSTISITGGLSGGAPNQPNDGSIDAHLGALTINANTITLIGNAGVEANATIGAPSANITTNTLTMQGGTGVGAIAAVGTGDTSTNITINAGSISMTGGSGGVGSFGLAADSLIGAGGPGFNADVTLNVTGAMTVSKGASAGFGNQIGAIAGGGNVAINAGSLSFGGRLGTTGAATLNVSTALDFNSAAVAASSLAITGAAPTQVLGGTTTFQTTTPFTNAGSLSVASGATLSTANSDLVNSGTGVISGAGTIDVGSGTLTNNGFIQPGGAGAVGTLNISGNYAQTASGALDVDLQSAVSYDVLNVSGSATLDGTLNIAYLGGYVPSGGNHIVLTYASSIGTFATLNNLTTLAPTYGATTFILGTGSGLDLWVSSTGGDWSTGSNWSLGREPLATEDAQVPDLAGGQTISILGSSHTVKSVVFVGDETLLLNAGSLAFSNTSSLTNGTLTLSGGNLTANANLTTRNANLLSGTLGGSGNFTVTNAYTQTGGIINIGGIASITQAAGNLGLGTITAAALTASAPAGDLTITGPINVVGDVSASAAGGIVATGAISTTGTGNITLNATNSLNSLPDGVLLDGAQITADAGTISITGNSALNKVAGPSFRAAGVQLKNSALVHTNTGAINITGQGGSFQSGVDGGDQGVLMQGTGPTISTVDGAISLTGTGGSMADAPTLADVRGIRVSSGLIQATGAGSISLTGFGGNLSGTNASGLNGGIVVLAPINSVNGDITLNGSGGTTTGSQQDPFAGSRGVSLGAAIESTGTGSITIIGSGGSSQSPDGNSGLLLSGPLIRAAGGSILIDGTGGSSTVGGGQNPGVAMQLANQIMVTGGGSVTINGTAGTSPATVHPAIVVLGDDVKTISTTSGSLSLNGVGDVLIGDPTSGSAPISITTGSGAMTLSGANFTVQEATISSGGAMNLTASGTLAVIATAVPTQLASNGLQTINANAITVQAAASGSGLGALIVGSAGQSITVGAGGITLLGGGGTNNNAQIDQSGATSSQSIVVNGAGVITLQGGSGTTGNDAAIGNDGTAQTLTFNSGGAINLTGGTLGTDNGAQIKAHFGNLAINGNPDITLVGGASGGASNAGNEANIGLGKNTAGATATISANNINLTGGAGGTGNGAVLGSQLTGQSINVTAAGSITLNGSTGTDAFAAIGSAEGDVSATVSAGGAITLTSGSGPTLIYGPVALIGSAGGFNANVAVSGSSVTLSGPLAIIGAAQGGAGTVGVTSGSGGIALNDGLVKTAGNVNLTASGGQITQAGGVINATTLTTVSATGTTLASPTNVISVFNGTNTTSGNISLASAASLLTISGVNEGGTGSATVWGSPIVITGTVSAGTGGVNLNSGGTLSESGSGLVSTSGTLTTSSTGGQTLAGANAVSIFNASNGASGDITLTNTAAPLTVAAISEPAGASLTINNAGAINFNAPITNPSGALSITSTGALAMGAAVNAASVALNGAGGITLSQNVNAGATLALSTTNAAITEIPGGSILSPGTTTISSGTGNVALTAVTNDFGGAVTVTGGVTQIADANALTLGAFSTGNLNATAAGNITATSAITSTGTVTLNSTAGGLAFNSGANIAAGGAVALTGATGISTAADVTSPSGGITYNSPLTLTGPLTVAGGTGPVTFVSTINGAQPLTVNTSGATSFGGTVGGTTALASLTTDAGGTTSLPSSVATTGAQTYGDAVALGAATTISGVGNTFGGTVNGAFALTVNDSGTTTFGGAVGGTTPLASLTTNAGGATAVNGGLVTTTGGQTYNDAVVLGAATTISGVGTTFASTLNGGFALTVNDSGTTTFGGAVGGTAALASLTTNAGGTTALNGGLVNTTGAQAYNDALSAPTVTLSAGAGSITATNAANDFTGVVSLTGGTVQITDPNALTLGAVSAGSLNATAAGNLTATAAITSAGTVTLNSTAGGLAFNPGANVSSGGAVALTGATGISSAGNVTSPSGGVSYNSPVTLTGPVTVSGGTGAVTFTGTVNGAQALTVNTSGATTFGGTVGGTTALASLTTDAGGTTSLPASVTTTGALTFGDAVSASTLTLNAGTVSVTGDISASDLTLNTVNGASMNSHVAALTVTNANNAVNITNVTAPGTLDLKSVTNTSGDFILDNTGNVQVAVPAMVGGIFKITAHSNIDVMADITANTTGTVSGPAIQLSALNGGNVNQISGTTVSTNNTPLQVDGSGPVLSGTVNASGVLVNGVCISGVCSATPTGGTIGSLTGGAVNPPAIVNSVTNNNGNNNSSNTTLVVAPTDTVALSTDISPVVVSPSLTTSTDASSTSQQQSGSGDQAASQSSGTPQARTQQASVSPSGRAAVPLTPAAAALVAAMSELREQKRQAFGKAVHILEQDPAAADLKSCGGPQLAGDCIAPRPAQPVGRKVATPAEAALPGIQRKVALLIGVGDYRGAIPKLNSPLKDIAEIGKIYREQFGYEVRTLPNADKATIIREFNRLILQTSEADSVTVFYAGHGQLVEKTGRGYWIPARASADDPSQWISNQDIGRALQNIPARQVLLVSDSCYSGSLTRDAKVQKAEVLADPAAVLARRSVTVLSSGGEEPVADAGKDGHSVFAWHFMQSLHNVQGWEKGVDVYGKLSADVQKDFPQEPQYGEAVGSGHQRGGDFLFEVRKY